ncbi:hypothetical protein HRI_000860000 [Hibiscus trionum]|uniref:Endonuclease/exonuclease/phosphatase domain-containing protein n=1 Tax=Hibiscus trionum TaxID=183268 RepID=A0A9W7H7B0_HIBTR|nr:hypothetical protein HRI_000860000 [Hibiscus trionum]
MYSCCSLTWNVRGLGKPEKKVDVRSVTLTSKARIVFLQETKLELLDARVIRKISDSANNASWVYSPSSRAVGGLCSIWDPDVFVFQSTVI